MKDISTFPLLTERLRSLTVRKNSMIRFFYTRSGEEHAFASDNSPVSQLIDPSWDPNIDNFGVSASYTIKNPFMLFGDKGICCKSAQLGVAIVWKSQESRQRGIVEGVSFGPDSQDVKVDISKVFSIAQFRGRVSFDTIIYLHKAGSPESNESHLANLTGTVLGIIDSRDALFDGSGSIFQINEISEPGGLLWKVSVEFEDPCADSFFSSVEIDLNTCHPSYCFVDGRDEKYTPSMLREVLANAMSIVVLTIRSKCNDSDWEKIIDGKCERGSVGNVVFYMLDKLGIKADAADVCSDSLRLLFEKVEL